MSLNAQVLLNTKTLPQEELDRLALSNCRCPSLDSHELHTLEELVELGLFTPSTVETVLDVSGITYFRNGDFTYVQYQFRNVDKLIDAIVKDNEETYQGAITGLIESDLTNLTSTYVIPTAVLSQHAIQQRDILVEATKRAFYI